MGAANNEQTAQQYERHPFQLSIAQLSESLQTHIESGLGVQQAEEYRTRYGENKLAGDAGVKWYEVFLKQISNAMILVSVCVRPRHTVTDSSTSPRYYCSPWHFLTASPTTSKAAS